MSMTRRTAKKINVLSDAAQASDARDRPRATERTERDPVVGLLVPSLDSTVM